MKLDVSPLQRKLSYILIAFIPFLIYFNAINNEYGMDDYYVTEGNSKIAQGISGIPEIFTSYYAQTDDKQYEYRPIVQTTFAVEKSLFRSLPDSQTIVQKQKEDVLTQANISHFVNIALYALTCVLLLYFLTILLPQYNFILPLIITLIFVVHPVHTEPVNNLKTRDELLMVLFLLAALVQWIQYANTGDFKKMVYASVFTLFAFLSKMNAFALFGFIPVIFYYLKSPNKRIYSAWGVTALVFAAVFLMRSFLPGDPTRTFEFFENPLFVDDTFITRLGLAFSSAWHYFSLLIYPENLSFYYGYNQIPIADFSYWQVWAVLLLLVPLGIYGLIRWWKRDALGLGLVLWLGVMAGSLNLTYPLVGIVADRFTYIFSIGFCMVLGILLWRGYAFAKAHSSPKTAMASLTVILVLIMGVYSYRTIARNDNWENRITLFRNDIKHLDQSVRAHTFLADDIFSQLPVLVKQPDGTAYIKEAAMLYEKAIAIDSTQSNTYNNLGAINFQFYQDYDKAIYFFSKARALDKGNTDIGLNLAYSYAGKQQFSDAIAMLKQVLLVEPDNQLAYDYLATLAGNTSTHPTLKTLYSDLPKENDVIGKMKPYWLSVAGFYFNQGAVAVAADSYAKAFLLDTTDKKLGAYVVETYKRLEDEEKARYFSQILSQ